MVLNYFFQKIKPFWNDIKGGFLGVKNNLKIKEDLFIAILIVLVGLASFGLGKLSVLEAEKTPISIINNQTVVDESVSGNVSNTASTNTATSTGQGIVFGSKSGTKYYYPWCSGAARIKPENRVWFKSIEDAKSAGLTPAANCSGLK